jgi:hypothetical protein
VVNTHGEGGEKRSADADDVERFAAAARVDEAVRQRRRAQHLHARAAEGAGVVDALLGALGDSATLHLSGGTSLTATVEGLGEDVVDVRTSSQRWWLALDAVLAVESSSPLRGDPADRDDVTLLDLLGDLVDSGQQVLVALESSALIHGEVIAAGESLVLRTPHPPRSVVVSLAAIAGVRRPG